MGSERIIGLRLTADNAEAVAAIREVKAEQDKLHATTQRNSSEAERLHKSSKSIWEDEQRAINARAAALMRSDVAADAALDKAWALANGYKQVGNQLLKASKDTESNISTMEKLGLHTKETRQEMMMLGKEAVIGDFSRMPRTFGALLTSSNLLSAGLTGTVAIGLGVVSSAAAVGMLAWESYRGSLKDVQKELDRFDGDRALKTMDELNKRYGEYAKLAEEHRAAASKGGWGWQKDADLAAMYTEQMRKVGQAMDADKKLQERLGDVGGAASKLANSSPVARRMEVESQIQLLEKYHLQQITGSQEEIKSRSKLKELKQQLADINKRINDPSPEERAQRAAQLASEQSYMAAIGNTTEALIAQADAAEWEMQKSGKTTDQIIELTAARHNEKIGILAVRAASLEGKAGREAELFLINEQIAALGRIRDAQGAAAENNSDYKALQEHQKNWEQVSSTLGAPVKTALKGLMEESTNVWTTMRDSFKSIFIDYVAEMATKKFVINAVIGTTASGVAGSAAASGLAGVLTEKTAEGAGLFGSATGLSTAGYAAAGAVAAYAIAKYGFGWGNSRENVGGQYLVGQASRDGFTGRNAQNWKLDGGWFGGSSSGTEYSAVTDAQQKALKATTDGLQRTFDSLGSVIGDLGVKTRAWSVDLTHEGDLNQMLADGMANSLVPSLKALQREGENLAQTATRVTDTFSATTTLINAAGLSAQESFGAIGIASTDARSKLIDAAGGLSSFSTLAAQYISNILGQSGQYDAALASVGRTFAELNIGLPTTREEFAKLYNEQLKLGNTGNVTRLMAVSTAFNSVISSAEQAGAAARASAVTQYQAAVSARDAVVAAADSVRAIQQNIASAGGGTTVSLAQLQDTARRAGAGDKSAQSQLGQQAQDYLAAAKLEATSAMDVHRAVAMVQSILTQTGATLDASASSATAHLDAAQRGNDYLAAISGSTQNTANNITALSTAMAALPGAIAAANGASAAVSGSPAQSITAAYQTAQTTVSQESESNARANAAEAERVAALQRVKSAATANATAELSKAAQIYNSTDSATGAQYQDFQSAKYYLDAANLMPVLGSGDLTQYRSMRTQALNWFESQYNLAVQTVAFNELMLDSDKQAAVDRAKARRDEFISSLPQFAVGSNYITYDGPAIVHKGEEITPRPFVDLQRAARDETNALLARLVQSSIEIKGEVEKLKASQHADSMAIVASTEKTAELLNDVSAGGGPLEVKVVE